MSESTSPVVAITFPKSALDFIDRARGDMNRSAYIRDAVCKVAGVQLSEEPPVLEMGPGRRSPLGAAAAAHGLSVKEYMRYTAEVAAGIRKDGDTAGVKKEKASA
jgi:hypothetical protein